MRMYDQIMDKKIQKISILLKISEASELRDTLNNLLSNTDKKSYHLHVSDSEYIHEITVSLYSENNIADFDKRIQRLIIEDR